MAEKTEKEKQPAQRKPAAGKLPAKVPPAVPAAPAVIEKSAQTPRLKKMYQEETVPALMRAQGKKNRFEISRLVKIVVNMGVSEAKDNIQALDSAREDLCQIAGQMPQVRRAKKSISNFKLRQGMPIGLRVTLRGDRMYEFMDRLVSMAVPRIRDFRGLEPSGFDGRGNYNLGLKEHYIFPEVNLEKSLRPRGMNITFVTTATDDQEGIEFLGRMGLPFKKQESSGKR